MPAADDSELFGLQAVSTFPVRAQDGSWPQTWEIKAALLSVILSLYEGSHIAHFILIILVYLSQNINTSYLFCFLPSCKTGFILSCMCVYEKPIIAMWSGAWILSLHRRSGKHSFETILDSR